MIEVALPRPNEIGQLKTIFNQIEPDLESRSKQLHKVT